MIIIPVVEGNTVFLYYKEIKFYYATMSYNEEENITTIYFQNNKISEVEGNITTARRDLIEMISKQIDDIEKYINLSLGFEEIYTPILENILIAILYEEYYDNPDKFITNFGEYFENYPKLYKYLKKNKVVFYHDIQNLFNLFKIIK